MTAIAFFLGALALSNFMVTAYWFPGIPRWFYAADAVFAVIAFFVAIAL